MPRNLSKGNRSNPVLPRATSFLQHDYFDFLTKPELRPHDPTGEAAFFHTIERTRSEISALSIMEGLDRSLELELAALVLDCITCQEMYESFRKAMAAFRELSSLLGPRNLAKIQKAAALLQPLATAVPEHHQYAPGVSLKDLVSSLDQFLQQLPWKTSRDVTDYLKWAKQNYPQTSDPTNELTRQLFVFFVSRCGLPRNEAEVRVAKIGNARLGWGVEFRQSYQGADNWKGSPTIRQRVARFRSKKHS